MRGALALLAVLALAACAPAKVEQSACTPGRTCLHIGNLAEPQTLDPQKITGKQEDHIVGDVMMGLTADDMDGNVVPGVATSWETSPDGLTWTFHLRESRWSDGRPVTADDFVFGWRRILDPKTAAEYAYLLYFIEGAQAANEGKAPLERVGVRAFDAHTLQVRLLHPVPYLLEMTKHQTLYPAPRHIVERYGDGWTKDHYVSNGPYTIASWRLGDRIHAVKNPNFYDAANVCIDEVYFYPTNDSIAAERRIKRGELDWNNDIQSNRISRLRRDIPAYVHTHTDLAVAYLAFNAAVPAFKDLRVRQALSMAIDRDFIARKLLRGGQTAAFTFTPPGVANYAMPMPPAWAAWTFERRQQEARRLLSEAGYGPANPLKIEITHRNTADPMLFMPAIQADWAQVGVQAALAPQEGQIAYQSYRARAFQVADAGWLGDYNDPKTFLDLMQSKTGAMNYGDYNSPEFDRLLDQGDHEPDAARRAAILARAESVMLADAPIAPVYFYINKNLVNPRITGFADNITDKHRIRWMCVK